MSKERKQSTEAAIREIRRRTRRKFSPEEKIRIVLEGLRGEQSISELCRSEGIAAFLILFPRVGSVFAQVCAERCGILRVSGVRF
jgi:hypothetical protein